MNDIFLVAAENKDMHCLRPLETELRRRFERVTLVSIFDELLQEEGGRLAEFASSRAPVVIPSSMSSLSLLNLIRARASYLSVGIEHGIAPFKAYTYKNHFAAHDLYLAPTQLWHDRLARLHPEHSEKWRLGGYPRISDLIDLRASASGKPEALERWSAASSRKLVIFSWGIDPTAVQTLPDRTNIAYLFHPADWAAAGKLRFSHAAALISTPELATFTMLRAETVFGDFSSLTLEALALGTPAFFIVDRRLYRSDCDLGEGFFDRTSPEFGAIPGSDIRIAAEQICSLEDLQGETVNKSPLEVDAILLPPSGDNRTLCADQIEAFLRQRPATATDSRPSERSTSADRVAMASFITRAYRGTLGRNPDMGGLANYIKVAESADEPLALTAVRILSYLTQSKEGRAHLAAKPARWPAVDF